MHEKNRYVQDVAASVNDVWDENTIHARKYLLKAILYIFTTFTLMANSFL
jgi:hypothetical protein